ncbi:putative Allantoicase [Cardiosporidium cionae]|uniref:Allantoicase n=1 Tax=Cardiosporidium cionae TaxID=476202 RepID=A0ABQ7J7R8_9APIC|nr:putative Allantoicase [Cardiosporidium cionae]|eukprot:KAF8820024.1 putative Allantoicase [Cardiosporidium cionae]
MIGVIKGIEIDTSHFTGNFPPKVSVEAAYIENLEIELEELIGVQNTHDMGICSPDDEIELVDRFLQSKTTWTMLIDPMNLQPGFAETAHHKIIVKDMKKMSHIRLNLLPDGGIARFRVYGETQPVLPRETLVDLASSLNGGIALGWSDQHYGTPKNLLLPHPPLSMKNGWETARSPNRPPFYVLGEDGTILNFHSNEWTILKLAATGSIECISLDTRHFKGNYPESCEIKSLHNEKLAKMDLLEQCRYIARNKEDMEWKTLLSRTRMQPHSIVDYCVEAKKGEYKDAKPLLISRGLSTHLFLIIYPDGGISRLRVWGRVGSGA